MAWGVVSYDSLGPLCKTNAGEIMYSFILTAPSSFCRSPVYAQTHICRNRIAELRVEWKDHEKEADITRSVGPVFLYAPVKDVKDCWAPVTVIEVTRVRQPL